MGVGLEEGVGTDAIARPKDLFFDVPRSGNGFELVAKTYVRDRRILGPDERRWMKRR